MIESEEAFVETMMRKGSEAGPRDPGAPFGVKVDVLGYSGDPFAALREEWKELRGTIPEVSPQQSWEWLSSWWELFGEGNRLRLVTVRDEGSGRLLGLAPFMIAGTSRLPGRLSLVGTGLTDYLDVYVRHGYDARVRAAIRRALLEKPLADEWLYADLGDLPPWAEAIPTFADGEWVGRTRSFDGAEVPIIAAEEPQAKLKGLDKKWRKGANNSINRVVRDAAVFRDAEDPEEGARRLVRLHREIWGGKPINPVHLTAAFEEFLARAAGRLAASGLGSVRELVMPDGEVLASHLCLADDHSLAGYLYGGNGTAARRYRLNVLYIWDLIELCHASGRARVSGLRGVEPYKLRWKPAFVEKNSRILLENPTLGPLGALGRASFAAAVCAVEAKEAVRGALRDERTPAAVSWALEGLRSLFLAKKRGE